MFNQRVGGGGLSVSLTGAVSVGPSLLLPALTCQLFLSFFLFSEGKLNVSTSTSTGKQGITGRQSSGVPHQASHLPQEVKSPHTRPPSLPSASLPREPHTLNHLMTLPFPRGLPPAGVREGVQRQGGWGLNWDRTRQFCIREGSGSWWGREEGHWQQCNSPFLWPPVRE